MNYELIHSSFTRGVFLFIAGVRRVSGINIYTPNELEVANGTSVRLKCTFTSTHPVSLQSAVVSWSFRPLNSGQDESVCTSCVSFLSSLLLFKVTQQITGCPEVGTKFQMRLNSHLFTWAAGTRNSVLISTELKQGRDLDLPALVD